MYCEKMMTAFNKNKLQNTFIYIKIAITLECPLPTKKKIAIT